METGKIKFFNEKGFGFIKPDAGEKDIFFHISGVRDRNYKPQQDDYVQYMVVDGDRGPKAISIELSEVPA